MAHTSPPTELILNHPRRSLGSLYLDWAPQPGADLFHEGQIYTVLERHHQYQFKVNRYHLHKIALYVQTAELSEEKSWVDHRWIIGNATCRYNARSEILRCVVNPEGPCHGCQHYSPRENAH
ncbi:MAG: hypothetical protein F6J95_008645 [Leptolyngbya sp. SIO1E4]|nr:hypothetical protein [Leptolyngbya sp. SIO1E4]